MRLWKSFNMAARYLIISSVALLALALPNQAWKDDDVLSYVDPLIGSVNGGNVFPGASIPYGMAKPVADTDSGSNQGGFTWDDAKITGFSTMHDSGTGGSPSLGNFPLFPFAKCPNDDINLCTFPKKARATPYEMNSAAAKPGFFSVKLKTGVQASMTAAQHTSLFRFQFPQGASSPMIMLDLTDLSDSRQDNATIKIEPTKGRMAGGGRFRPSFGVGSYDAFFCADFSGGSIADSGIFVNTRPSTTVQELTISRSINGYPLPGGGFIRFKSLDSSGVLVRVGISLKSAAKACKNAEKEIPDFNFEQVKSAAEGMWRNKLKWVTVDDTGMNSSYKTMFYSSMYRTMLNPQDYSDENPLWESSEPYFDSFYCLWDSFRSQLPFLAVLDPDGLARMIRGLISIYDNEGWLPDCRMSLSRGYTQGGSNADIVLADAYVKGITGGIDWNKGYAAVVKDAEEEPYDWCCRGRGGLDSWHSLGYIPVQDLDFKGFGTMTRSVSRSLEYAYNDFAVAEIAKGLGKSDDSQKYLSRSGNWQNLYNPNVTSTISSYGNRKYQGFFQPKNLNGTWGYQDPLYCSHIDPNPNSVCSLQNTAGETFESSIWEYGFYVPHDQGSLIKLYGGQKAYVDRLNALHDAHIGDIGNEPSFVTIFQYHFASRPGLSAARSHFYVNSARGFTDSKDGLPGNDDSGAMGSFVAFNMMGLFPNPGQNVYLIIPPYFPSVSVTSPITNKTATVRIDNFDPTYAAIYIQNATLDGKPYKKNWLTHEFFLQGGELVLHVGKKESSWGTRTEDLPPSLGEYPSLGTMAVPWPGDGVGSIADVPPRRPQPKGKTSPLPESCEIGGGSLGKVDGIVGQQVMLAADFMT
jgi:predicted alpha-1,2-mannosidase